MISDTDVPDDNLGLVKTFADVGESKDAHV
jgi:hypothetical protein